MVMGQTVGSADVVVIGGGPGGYVAAIRAAQLGKRVILIEKNKLLGGVCLRCGCIPSKSLIHASEFLYHLDHSDNMGITVDHIHFDPKKMQAWKNSIIDRLSGGIEQLCQKHGIEIVHGTAYFQNSRTIGIEPLNENDHLEYGAIEYKHCIIASGSKPRIIPNLPVDGKFILGSKEALTLDYIPKNLVVVGGGYIGVELGIVYAKFGTKVTIVTTAPRLIPAIDKEIVDVLEESCKSLKIDILYNASVSKLDKTPEGGKVTVQSKEGQPIVLDATNIIVAVGRVSDVHLLKLEATHVKLDKDGFIITNEKRQTNDPHIYAIGDAAGGALLAHKASMEGRVAAEAIAGLPAAFDMRVIPAVIYSDPEVAMVGITEEEAVAKGHAVKIGKFPFKASGRALTMNQPLGFVKVVADEKTHQILGVHIVGADASDLISEAALAIEMGAKVEDVGLTIHPHPTLSETLSEAMDAVLGHSVHVFQKSPSADKKQ